MLEQGFDDIVKRLRPVLKKISNKNRFLGYIDNDDLYQEALINLWQRYEAGEFMGKTPSYIIKSCYFHIQNYIRAHKVRGDVFSMQAPWGGAEDKRPGLEDALIDNKNDNIDRINSRFMADEIMKGGLTRREKDVLKLLYSGFNIRDTARELGISHVRVLKVKNNICLKSRERFFDKG